MGLTVVDAGVLIGFLDRKDAHHPAAVAALADLVDSGERLMAPASVLAEVLVGPARRGLDAVAAVLQFVERLPIEIAPLDKDTALAAATIRAAHRSVKLPDALVLATASVIGADTLVTTDRGWPTGRRLGLRLSIHVI